ncbi:MAG TPA: DUF2059 domain-containing protein [Terriglobales bacterium]|nr:DUF2059 domain-containing protein [Terriglobales bacterium]
MRRFLMATCLVAVMACSLSAQQAATAANQPPTTEQVMKFFEIMHIREQMQSLLQTEQKQINVMLTEMFNKKLPGAATDERKKFDSIMNDMMSDLFSNYPVEDILRDMVPVFQKHLSESDLKEIIAFYSSPTGKKVIQEMPAMSAEAMRVSYTRMQPRIEEMMKKMESRLDAMAASEKNNTKTNAVDPKSSDPKN